ncbi:MAG: nitroreductase family protein [Cyclobacteriaceae bacterium]
MSQRSSEIHYPVAGIISERKSIRAFSSRTVEEEKIRSLFEAVRWAPSSSNEQPWVFIYATKDHPELHDKMISTLSSSNQVWASQAPLLVFSLARKKFLRNGNDNTYALYDLGGANAFLSLQAVHLGLQIRQMAGYDRTKAVDLLNVPADLEPGVFIAIGYPGDPEQLPEPVRQKESAPRERFLQETFVRSEAF